MAEDLQLKAVASKKRKLENNDELQENSRSILSPVNSVCENENSRPPSPADLEKVDLQSEESEEEYSTAPGGDGVSRREAATSTSELSGESPPPTPARPMMPSEAELDEFFAEMEKQQQKRFIEKYNYDIVKDEPLEGKYEWVLLKGAN